MGSARGRVDVGWVHIRQLAAQHDAFRSRTDLIASWRDVLGCTDPFAAVVRAGRSILSIVLSRRQRVCPVVPRA